MKFKFLFCGMFVLIGAAQSTGLRVLGRAGAVALQTHVRCCTVKHGTEFKVPPGLKLAEISRVGLPPKADMKKLIEESKKFPPIDFSQYKYKDDEKDTLYRIDETRLTSIEKSFKENLSLAEDGMTEKFPLKNVAMSSFEKADTVAAIAPILPAVGLVSSSFAGMYGLGTGFAIRDNAVLTAGHNICDFDRYGNNMLAREVTFDLRYDNGKSHLTLPVKSYKIPKEWEVGHDFEYDFALLILESAVFDTVLNLVSVGLDMKLPIPVRVAGYPDRVYTAGKILQNDPRSLYANSGHLEKTSNRGKTLHYTAMTAAGMSGAPIFVMELPIVLGVHTRGGMHFNSGVHYADHMLGYLHKWFQELDQAKDDKVALKEIIAELAQSEEEKEHLLEKMDSIAAYPAEKWRAYLAFYLDLYRKK